MKKILIAALILLLPALAQAKCVNGTSYVLKGYFENSNNDPVTGKTLSEVKFDLFYDDGTSSTGNNATAEMGQGWYRYSYTSNGKAGVWVVRDSTGSYKNFPGGLLESLCDSQVHTALVYSIWDEVQSGHTTAGTFGKYLDAQVSTAGGGSSLTAQEVRDALKLAPSAGSPASGSVDDKLNTAQSDLDNPNQYKADVSSLATSAAVSNIDTKLGSPTGASVSADIAAVLDDTGTSGVVLANDAITAAKIAADAIGASEIAAGAITSSEAPNLDVAVSSRPSAVAVADAVWDEDRTGHTTSGTFGYYLDAPVSTAGGGGSSDWTTDEKNQLRYRLGIDGTEAAPSTNTPNLAILDEVVEGAYTMKQVFCMLVSRSIGKATGGATTSIKFRNLADTVDRITMTVDSNGNRSALTFDLTGCI